MKKLRLILAIGILTIIFFAGHAAASTTIEYELGGGWTYEEEYPGTLTLTDNPSGGITANIDVGSEAGGGLNASRHDLPGFSIFNNGFIQLEYGSLTNAITGSADLGLCLELEFYAPINAIDIRHQLGMSLDMNSDGSVVFDTWLENDISGEREDLVSVPNGLSIEGGALGLYFHDSSATPYFIDNNSNVIYLPTNWDLSAISAMHFPSVDNDYDGSTTFGGTIVGSVNLQRVVYGSGAPAPTVPIPGAVWLRAGREKLYSCLSGKAVLN
ncbi:MAG: hypothetical protein KKC46_19905 [Proteobacteria bacterium]|nr:hypothetical protein [Pseudomonadota bacterium]